MDQRIESFLADVLALAGENPDAIREGVRVALADCEAIFRAQETNKRMRDQAAHEHPDEAPIPEELCALDHPFPGFKRWAAKVKSWLDQYERRTGHIS